VLLCVALCCFALLCFACFLLLCFVLLCFALLCFALLCFFFAFSLLSYVIPPILCIYTFFAVARSERSVGTYGNRLSILYIGVLNPGLAKSG
jgi:hypothetical protein